MKMTSAQYASVLFKLTKDLSGRDLSKATDAFVKKLGARHELTRWREIVRAFDNLWRREYGSANVHVTTAHDPTKKFLDEVHDAYPNADVTHSVDDKLMGGAILQVDDALYDGSIAGQLKRLQNEMTQ